MKNAKTFILGLVINYAGMIGLYSQEINTSESAINFYHDASQSCETMNDTAYVAKTSAVNRSTGKIVGLSLIAAGATVVAVKATQYNMSQPGYRKISRNIFSFWS